MYVPCCQPANTAGRLTFHSPAKTASRRLVSPSFSVSAVIPARCSLNSSCCCAWSRLWYDHELSLNVEKWRMNICTETCQHVQVLVLSCASYLRCVFISWPVEFSSTASGRGHKSLCNSLGTDVPHASCVVCASCLPLVLSAGSVALERHQTATSYGMD